MTTMRNILKALWFTPGLDGRWGLPAIFRGSPGVGKTSILRQACSSFGLHVETVLASLRQPEDFLGLPIPAHDQATREQVVAWMRDAMPSAEPHATDGNITFTAVTYAPPRWAIRLALAGRGVCFLDEINSAPPAVQAALLRVALEGVVGDLSLPSGIRFAAAMNPTEDAAGGWDIAAPLANRFAHLQWSTPAVDDWSEYMIGGAAAGRPGKGSADAEESRTLGEWGKHYPQAIGVVSAFLRARRDLFLCQPKSGDPKASEAWPSPRTWHMATHALAAGTLHALPADEREGLVSGFVGAGAASELFVFGEKLDLPDPEQLLDGKVQWSHNSSRLDRTAAVLSSCCAFLAHMGPKAKGAKEKSERAWKLLDKVVADAADIVVPSVRALHKGGFSTGGPEAVRVLNKVYPIIDSLSGR